MVFIKCLKKCYCSFSWYSTKLKTWPESLHLVPTNYFQSYKHFPQALPVGSSNECTLYVVTQDFISPGIARIHVKFVFWRTVPFRAFHYAVQVLLFFRAVFCNPVISVCRAERYPPIGRLPRTDALCTLFPFSWSAYYIRLETSSSFLLCNSRE